MRAHDPLDGGAREHAIRETEQESGPGKHAVVGDSAAPFAEWFHGDHLRQAPDRARQVTELDRVRWDQSDRLARPDQASEPERQRHDRRELADVLGATQVDIATVRRDLIAALECRHHPVDRRGGRADYDGDRPDPRALVGLGGRVACRS